MIDPRRYTSGRIALANLSASIDSLELRRAEGANFASLLALSKLLERREIPSGSKVLLFGFGGGLTYAGQVITCP